MKNFRSTFKIGSSSSRDFVYHTLAFNQHTGGVFIVQRSYIWKLPDDVKLESDTTSKKYSRKIDWIAVHTRPDIAFDMVSLCIIYLEDANKAEKATVKLTRKCKHSSDHKDCLPKLFNPPRWKLIVYADTSFAKRITNQHNEHTVFFAMDRKLLSSSLAV